MSKEYKIYKKVPGGTDRDTGYEFLIYEEKAIWGFRGQEYSCFSKKYYTVKEIEIPVELDYEGWY